MSVKENITKMIIENNNIIESDIQLGLEEWSKPEIKLLGVNKITLGHSASGSDAGTYSATACSMGC